MWEKNEKTQRGWVWPILEKTNLMPLIKASNLVIKVYVFSNVFLGSFKKQLDPVFTSWRELFMRQAVSTHENTFYIFKTLKKVCTKITQNFALFFESWTSLPALVWSIWTIITTKKLLNHHTSVISVIRLFDHFHCFCEL